MEYSFGRARHRGELVEILKIIGAGEIEGETRLVKEYGDCYITDVIEIAEKIGQEGAMAVYAVRKHYTIEDRHTPNIGETEREITELEITQMENERAITDNEIAIMELQEMINN